MKISHFMVNRSHEKKNFFCAKNIHLPVVVNESANGLKKTKHKNFEQFLSGNCCHFINKRDEQ